MSALAGLLREAGHSVTGSDEHVYPPASTLLARLGVDGRDRLGAAPPRRRRPGDLRQRGHARQSRSGGGARNAGCRTMSFPQALEELFLAGAPAAGRRRHARQDHVGVHAGVGARTRGRDPGCLIGGAPRDLPHAAPRSAAARGSSSRVTSTTPRTSTRRPKFLHYRPDTLLLTAVEFDHADIYRDLDAREGARSGSCSRLLRPGAPLVACGDFPHVLDVVAGAATAPQLFGLDERNDLARDGPASTTG